MKKITTLISALFITAFGLQVNAQITVYPYLEDFESGPGSWVADNTTNGSWALGTPAAPVINSAASGANSWATNLTGNYNTGEDAWVTSPVFDMSSLTAPSIQLSIWWNSEFSWDGLVMQSSIDAGGSWQNVGAMGDPINWFTDNSIGGNPGGQQEGWSGRNSSSNGSGGWVTASHTLTGLAGQSNVLIRLAFGSDGSVEDDGVAFDDINVFDVSCPQPTVLNATGILATSANLAWMENGTATAWDVEWGANGFIPGAGTMVSGTTTNPHSLTGLTAMTMYDYYVRSICGAGDTSMWTGPYTFTTACLSMIAPWMDSVETHTPTTALTLSNCWSATAATSYDWNIDGAGSTPSGGTGPAGAFSGVNYFYIEASGSSVGDVAELNTPNIDLSGVTNASLDFYYHMFGPTMGNLYVDIYDGATWSTVDSIIGEQQTLQADPWLLKSVDLSSFSGTIQAKFRAVGGGSFTGDISLDNIEVTGTLVTCPMPDSLTTTNITTTSADLGWDENGSATTWEIEWDTTGFVQGTGNTVITTTNPHNLTGLTINTSYEFYVRAICGAADTSSWSMVGTFNTLNVGINETTNNINLSLHPNPTTGLFTLNINTTDINTLDIKIVNLQGQVVFAKNNFDNVSNVNEQIDLSNNAKGIYFIAVTSDKGVSTHKVVVQ